MALTNRQAVLWMQDMIYKNAIDKLRHTQHNTTQGKRMEAPHPESILKALYLDEVVNLKLEDLNGIQNVFLRELPSVEDGQARDALRNLMEKGVSVVTPLSEQLAKPLPGATIFLTSQDLSTDAIKQLPNGTCMAVYVDDDTPQQLLDIFEGTGMPCGDTEQLDDYSPVITELKCLKDKGIHFKVIRHVEEPNNHPDESPSLLEYVSLSSFYALPKQFSKFIDKKEHLLDKISEHDNQNITTGRVYQF